MSEELVVENLTKIYGAGAAAAVDGVSFGARSGEFLVLLGPSGCGKTTSMRCIGGLERPDGGRISIRGALVSDTDSGLFVPPNRRDVSMVFQSYAIWPHMTVFENIAFPLEVRRLSKEAIRKKVVGVMETLHLEAYGDRPASQLSGGQQQRVALARALVYDPRLLLLDEPLSNLDATLRARVRFELKELQRRAGVTTVYVTHDQSEAVVLGDRVIVMNHGRIEQYSPPADVYNRPATLFVANFTGVENILHGSVEAVDGEEAVLRTAGGLRVRGQTRAPLAVGGRAAAAIRAGNIRLQGASPAGRENAWSASVSSVTFLGVQNRYALRAGADELVAIEASAASAFGEGDVVEAAASPSLVSIYPV